jgi:hypothetical protein
VCPAFRTAKLHAGMSCQLRGWEIMLGATF